MKDTISHRKIALGLSGGVDSAVSALLLKEKGYEVTGVYMQCWNEKADGCKADEDKSYAVQNAAKLGIKFLHLDFIKEYKERVISYFYDEYSSGRTPNPDVMCNKEVKFGLFYDWARENGFYSIATGHYARNEYDSTSGNYCLKKGIDPTKDQSYFLYLLDQQTLSNTLFPIGNMLKTEVRKLALEYDLPSAKRPDSTGICFIGEVDIKEFLKKRIQPQSGVVRFVDGREIGFHEGVWYYTIGQRHGFTVKEYFGKPLYVVSKDIKKNELIVGLEEDAYKDTFVLEDLHEIFDGAFSQLEVGDLKCDVRVRHLGKLFKCTIQKKGNLIRTNVANKIFGLASGQSAVFYQGETVLGGAIISTD